MKITKIQLKNFRAFRGPFTIDLGGKNLLVYGENGSGKSSLYEALNHFFAPEEPFSRHRNVFADASDDAYVKLDIGDVTNPSTTYEWEETTHPFSQGLIAETTKTKGFLDYRVLLATHYDHRESDKVNLFRLLIQSLLANLPNPITNRPLGLEWQAIESLCKQRQSPSRTATLPQRLSEFNLGVTSLLGSLEQEANQMLALFGQNVTIQLGLPPPGLVWTPPDKVIDNQNIDLRAAYYSGLLDRHHHFLNEARLTAIAISIYLAARRLNPPSRLRVLFLDDVLIGLDLSNRLPLLSILAQYFTDWQIILTTYDRVWFEMARDYTEGAPTAWAVAEFFCQRTADGDWPVYHPSKDFLAAAQEHLAANDLKGAAVYIRSAYEREMKVFCDEHHLPVPYSANHRQNSIDFWNVVSRQEYKGGGLVVPRRLANDVKLHRNSVLNPLSHTQPVNLVRREVETAWNVVKELKDTLRGVTAGNLK